MRAQPLARLRPTRSLRAGERHLHSVRASDDTRRTILFCDIRGFSSLAEHTPAVQLAVFVSRHLGVMAGVVAGYGGEVAALTGDGLMAVFAGGAHERRALSCGLAMQATEPPVGVGIGIATGVVATMSVHVGGHWELSVVGDAVNVAKRLESQASAGEVLATRDAIEGAAAAGGLRSELVGQRRLEGRTRPVEVYRVGSSTTTLGKPVRETGR